MPADIIGANLFNFQTSSFTLTRGPIFTELLLADEINRTPPKTQAALLEAMQERQVTIDGQSHELGDRSWLSLLKIRSSSRASTACPKRSSTVSCSSRRWTIRRSRKSGRSSPPTALEEAAMEPPHGVSNGWPRAKTIAAAMKAVNDVRLVDEVVDYIAALIRGTREDADLETGASPRAGAMLAGAARARAAIDGRDFVIPDDVKALAPALLRHRVILSPAAEINGRKVEEIVECDHRGDRGAALIYPTRAAVIATAAGRPVALAVAAAAPERWFLALAWPLAVVSLARWMRCAGSGGERRASIFRGMLMLARRVTARVGVYVGSRPANRACGVQHVARCVGLEDDGRARVPLESGRGAVLVPLQMSRRGTRALRAAVAALDRSARPHLAAAASRRRGISDPARHPPGPRTRRADLPALRARRA